MNTLVRITLALYALTLAWLIDSGKLSFIVWPVASHFMNNSYGIPH